MLLQTFGILTLYLLLLLATHGIPILYFLSNTDTLLVFILVLMGVRSPRVRMFGWVACHSLLSTFRLLKKNQIILVEIDTSNIILFNVLLMKTLGQPLLGEK